MDMKITFFFLIQQNFIKGAYEQVVHKKTPLNILNYEISKSGL
jgi:hypothetical protein